MQQGADIKKAFTRLKAALEQLDRELEFAFDQRLGFLTTCPTNLGTAMRASVHIKIPLLSQHAGFERLCDALGLSIRGLHDEHSKPVDGIHDISNKHRLGVTERDIYRELYHGVKRLIELESQLMERPGLRPGNIL